MTFGVLLSFTYFGVGGPPPPDAAHLRHLLVPAGPFWEDTNGDTPSAPDSDVQRWDDPRAGRQPALQGSAAPILRASGGGVHVQWFSGANRLVFSPSVTPTLAPVSWYARVRLGALGSFDIGTNLEPQYVTASTQTTPRGVFAGSEQPFDDLAQFTDPPVPETAWFVFYGVFSPTEGAGALGWDGHRLDGLTLRSGENTSIFLGGEADCTAVALYDAAHTAEQSAAVVAYLHALPGGSTDDAPDPFVPTDLGDDCCLWIRKFGDRFEDALRTDPVTAAGDPIGSWTDASSGGRNPFAAATARPLEPEDRNGAVFNGANTLTTPPLDAFAGDFFVGLVIVPTTLGSGFVRFFERAPAGTGVYLGTEGAADTLIAFVAGAMSAAVAMSAGDQHVVAVTRTGAVGALYLDGVLVDTWPVPETAIPDAPSMIGGPDGSGPAYDGLLQEAVVAKNTDDAKVANLLGYLATV